MSFGPGPISEPEGSAHAGAPDPAAEEHPSGDEGAAPEPQTAPTAAPVATTEAPSRTGRFKSPNMLPGRESRRSPAERILVRLIATCGIVGIGVAIAAIMVHSKSQGWIIGLVVSIVSVVLSAILWSSRQL
jgi:hypothetical protein